MPTTAGSIALGRSRPKRDAFITARLRQAGAIILGKGTLTEFANFISVKPMPTGYSSQLRFQLFQSGGNLAKVGFGFNPFDPRIDPRTPNPAINDPYPPNTNPAPYGVTFTGPAFSEGKLIGFAYAFEQATQHRVSPASTTPK